MLIFPGCCSAAGLDTAVLTEDFHVRINTIHLVNTTTNQIFATLPANPEPGIVCYFADHGYIFNDFSSGFGKNPLKLIGNGYLISGTGIYPLATAGGNLGITFDGNQWVVFSR